MRGSIFFFLCNTVSIVLTKKVVILSIEGLTTSLLPKLTQSFSKLKEKASFTFNARSTYFNNPASGLVSLLCSEDSAYKGIISTKTKQDWFDSKDINENPFQCSFEAFKVHANLKTYFLHSNSFYEYFTYSNKFLDQSYYCPTSDSQPLLEIISCDKQTFLNTKLVLENDEDSFILVEFLGLTKIGKFAGFGSAMYNDYAILIDSYIEQLSNVIMKIPNSILHITSLNGAESGTKLDSTFTQSSILIPWIMIGKDFNENFETSMNVDIRDSIPTILEALGVLKISKQRGRVIFDIFREEKKDLIKSFTFHE